MFYSKLLSYWQWPKFYLLLVWFTGGKKVFFSILACSVPSMFPLKSAYKLTSSRHVQVLPGNFIAHTSKFTRYCLPQAMALLIVLHYLTWVIIFWDLYSFQFSAYCLVPKSKTHILGFCYCSISFTHTAFVSGTYCCVTNLPQTELLKTIIFSRSWFSRSALAAGLIHSSVVCWGWVRWLHFWRLSGWADWLSFTHLTEYVSFISFQHENWASFLW